MKIFKLPDLGEGLPDAIIREWYIKAGDAVKKDQPLVSMETAKALVDVPAPFDGKIEKLFGNANDTIETGKPLIGFEGEGAAEEKKDTGTVVGKIEQSNQTLTNDIHFSERESTETPAMRARARKLNAGAAENLSEGYEKLSGIKRAMVISMQQSHRDIVPVTLIDDADISKWVEKQDITVRIIRAIINACKIEPALNAHFNGNNMSVKKFSEINLGMAVDMPHGLYVPVIKNVAALSDLEIRTAVDRYKQQAQTKSLAQNDLHGATIVLSNFGSIAGKYANPIILPPTVAIVGIGRIQHQQIPLSITIDHRAITGGEAARFLRAMMDALS
ncbi:MAG: hypothetical protein A3I77_02720 [Gammaproteobacteria bacterium RIFCSPLOWO2_02_FULL_42_14]|nr:MAG: hypothetical protein A3B71_08095 [Gammaproteobacteria bacterium RIFCSPHIGHO2_02_FULL_42_43]OGT27416.1 MAG: hypothetical protein A2624_06745 [Gammaproteobacteria bacterium RIFCSPHIGHO2_01_FULL_42_8]OGT52375.1 MAG: hypothetical protein A3E54_01970 [Gammaproteobacteria bacterium RIFCSPHIGHO2_12_FULL_41_25]OGT63334.1 MAG: hypothetical protein A3I77_02720 [Gammaproteobacteria bacterium RIFCSPLOWO2_02_FULL_42_14]OGT86302.1 MAG: hypothetical protein A3G86_07185 [Gammaproteobacteria bacterium R